MREPINVGITSSSFRQLSPEIIILISWLRLPVLVRVNVASRVDKGAICIAARRDDKGRLQERVVMRQKNRAGAEVK